MRAAVLSATAAAAAAAANPLQLTVSPDGTSYSVALPNGWPTLQSAPAALRINGDWAALTPAGAPATAAGTDAWGDFSETTVTFAAGGVGSVLATKFRTYATTPAIVFEQVVLQAIAPGGGDRDNVSSAFPAWVLPASSPLGVMQWRGPFIDGGASGPKWTTWDAAGDFETGLDAGPMVLFDKAAGAALVFSTASNFMATNLAQFNGALHVGVLGSVEVIPAGFSTSSVLWYGEQGVNPTVMAWGAGLLAAYGKGSSALQTDFTANYLTYNTDHGMYYYYTTANYSDYGEVLRGVNAYAQSQGIPYRNVLLDSWWYFKGYGDGVSNWTATPAVFPPGGDGALAALTQETGWQVIGHNRFWANDTVYAKANGGAWDFFIDPRGEGGMSVPLEQAFWEWLLPHSAKWGLRTYEQDWLYNELEGVSLLTTNATAARTWLLQMQAGAAAAGVTIQFCMPYPRHMLQSVEMPAVTQVRASDDHVANLPYAHLQWRIGYSSLFAWAVNVAPFKDGFYSTRVQPGGSVGNAVEESPALQAAISVLSAGPVAPGDGVGFSDAALLLRTCTTGGALLKPSRSATAVDRALVNNVFRDPAQPQGELYATYSLVSGWAWDTLLAAAVNATVAVGPADLAPIRADAGLNDPAVPSAARLAFRPLGAGAPAALRRAGAAADLGTVAYAVNATTGDPATLVVAPFSQASPITVAACGETDFAVWHTAPVFANGIALLGDVAKFVPMAPARVRSVAVDGDDVTVRLVGEPGEAVPFTVWKQAGGATSTITCVLGPAGAATLSVAAGSCA